MATIHGIRATLLGKSLLTTKERYTNLVPGRIGASQTLIDTGIPGMIYVRIEGSGQVVTAANATVPAEYNHPVLLARSKANPRYWEVIASRAQHQYPSHASHHDFRSADVISTPSNKQKCSWCDQYTEAQEPCRYCGGPN